ncbi:MAG: cell wall-binding repeat-containing protein, partial [Anaerotignum sp.]|nr:cell wall-binding repeat-containing protein [Anaerotignum sp.]
MKKVFRFLLALTVCMSFVMPSVSAAEPEAESFSAANSWRYENGELISELSLMADAYHPDATLTGIDVSEHQGTIDWEKVKAAGIDFAIIRCGYGQDMASQDDLYFEYNADECERLGIPYGVYLYSYATNTTRASGEADHALRLLEGRHLSYPVYFDMEDSSTIGSDLGAIAETFCDKISAAGYPVGVYANLNWWNNYLTDNCFDDWHRWVAQYNSSCQYEGTYALWQYTSSGSVNGISGRVDMNYQIGYPADHGTSSVTEASLKTNKNTYQSGEAILITASSGKNGAWVAIYGEDDEISSATPSYYWYYVNGSGAAYGSDKIWKNGETYNIYDGICSMRTLNGSTISGALPAGDYVVAILYGDYSVEVQKKITITEPTSRPSLKVSKDAYLTGEDIDVTAVSYEDGAWVGLYPDTSAAFDSGYIYYFYTECNNGLTMTMQEQQKNASSPYVNLPAGAYTVVLFGDSGYDDPVMQKKITVSNIYTDKETYEYDEPILVMAAQKGTDAWVGLYQKDDVYASDLSFYWYYLREENNPVNILTATSNNRKGFTAGEYKVVLFSDGGYTAVDSVSITITKKETGRYILSEPTCTALGSAIVYYSDGTQDVISLPKADHVYSAVVTDPTCMEGGYTTYTCICNDTYVAEPTSALGHTFGTYISNGDGTKTATCIRCPETDTLPENVMPAEADVFRVYGLSRCDTAMKAADTLKEELGIEKFDTVIVANAQNFADALGGSYLAAAKDAPILMTNAQSEANVKNYIRNSLKDGGTIYILGGPLAVASSFEDGMDGFAVKRLYGTSRYDTNLEILKEAGVAKHSEVLVCTGTNFADSL